MVYALVKVPLPSAPIWSSQPPPWNSFGGLFSAARCTHNDMTSGIILGAYYIFGHVECVFVLLFFEAHI